MVDSISERQRIFASLLKEVTTGGSNEVHVPTILEAEISREVVVAVKERHAYHIPPGKGDVVKHGAGKEVPRQVDGGLLVDEVRQLDNSRAFLIKGKRVHSGVTSSWRLFFLVVLELFFGAPRLCEGDLTDTILIEKDLVQRLFQRILVNGILQICVSVGVILKELLKRALVVCDCELRIDHPGKRDPGCGLDPTLAPIRHVIIGGIGADCNVVDRAEPVLLEDTLVALPLFGEHL